MAHTPRVCKALTPHAVAKMFDVPGRFVGGPTTLADTEARVVEAVEFVRDDLAPGLRMRVERAPLLPSSPPLRLRVTDKDGRTHTEIIGKADPYGPFAPC